MAQYFADAVNIPKNVLLPWNPMQSQKLLGTVEYVAIEVVVASLFRRLLGFPRKAFGDLIQVHAASMAFLGGASAPFGPIGPLEQTPWQNLIDGAKGIPAVLLGQYAVETFKRGFHVPGSGWTMSDVFASAASKTISRPLFGLIYPTLKRAKLHVPMQEVNQMQTNQSNNSQLPHIA